MRQPWNSGAGQFVAQTRVGAQQLILGGGVQFAPHLPGEPAQTQGERRRQQDLQLLTVGLRDVQPLEQVLLRVLIVEQYAFAPGLAQRIQAQPRIREPWGAALPAAGQGFVGIRRVGESSFNALGSDRCRGIDTQPAPPFDPHFIPCMGVALPQYPVIGKTIESASLVTRDHARGYSAGTHEDGERRCVVFAEAALGVDRNSSTELSDSLGGVRV